MPAFSPISAGRLATCDPDLQRLFNRVVQEWDCTVLVGYRDKAAQDTAVEQGQSKDPWPTSKHNSDPARAADVAPFPVIWGDLPRFYYFAGYVLGVAQDMEIAIRWGGDWRQKNEPNPRGVLNDLVHFELA
jgi:hypothetical protein